MLQPLWIHADAIDAQNLLAYPNQTHRSSIASRHLPTVEYTLIIQWPVAGSIRLVVFNTRATAPRHPLSDGPQRTQHIDSAAGVPDSRVDHLCIDGARGRLDG